MVLGTALLRGCWGRAPGLQYGPEDRSRDLPAPHACTHCLSHPPPCLHSHPYPWPAPTPLLAPLSHAPACPPARCPVRGAQAASRCFRGGGGPCYVPAQRSRDAAAVAGANKGKVRLGGWVAVGTCRHPPRWHRCGGQGRSGTVPMPRDGGLPLACRCWGAEAAWAARCCPLRRVAHSWAHACSLAGSAGTPPRGSSEVQWSRGAPCWVGPHLGWGLGRKRGSRN